MKSYFRLLIGLMRICAGIVFVILGFGLLFAYGQRVAIFAYNDLNLIWFKVGWIISAGMVEAGSKWIYKSL